MIGKKELRGVLGNKPFITKKELKDLLGYKKYDDVRKFFYGLDHIGTRYMTEDVIGRIVEMKECEE